MKAAKNKQAVVLLKGLPASGKSTAAKEMVRMNSNWKRINKDDLRAMIDDGQWSPSNEKLILKVRDGLIMQFVNEGFNVIVDDTNLHPKHEEHIRQLVGDKAKVEVQFFDVSVDECIERDLKRTNSVGEKVIRKMYTEFLKPKPEPFVQDSNLPDAYIFDVDGTLAFKGDRGIYEYDKVLLDTCNEPVARVLRQLVANGNTIIVCSGRNDDSYNLTAEWLNSQELPFDMLLMRKTGDMRKDSIVKKELYDKNINGKYHVLGVFDDRDQVVEMWRNIGLTCFQVAYGDF